MLLLATLLFAAATPAAVAGSSQWEETEGGRLRVVTEPFTAGMKELRAALQIDLAPGWKTYWREPGSAGIPPQITVAGDGVEASTVHFPVPMRIDDPYGSWAGYTAPLSLPLTIDLEDDAKPSGITAEIVLGICHDICIPVMADFAVPLGGPVNSIQSMVIDAAFASLPEKTTSTLSVGGLAWTPEGLLEITLDDQTPKTDTDVFLSAGSEFAFKPPQPTDDPAVYTAEPIFDPATETPSEIVVAVRSGNDMIETTLPAPAR